MEEKIEQHRSVFHDYLKLVKHNAKVMTGDTLGEVRRVLKGCKGTTSVQRKVKKNIVFF